MVCCGLATGSIGLCINAVGVFYTPVSESLGILRGTFAMHATISLVAMAVISLFIPSILNKYSYKKILILSVVVASGSTVLMAYSQGIGWFYLLAALRGISTGLFSIVPLTIIINQWFNKKNGLATSLVLSFSGIAGALGSPIFAFIIENFGWKTAYLIKGFAIFLVCLPAIVYPFSMNPIDDGLLPYGYEEEKVQEKRLVKLKNQFDFKNISFIAFFSFSVLLVAITGLAQHLPGFAESIGYPSSMGAVLLSVSMLGNISSKLLIGIISDVFGAISAMLLMLFSNIVGILLLFNHSNMTILLIGAFLFGSIYSVGPVGCALLTKHLFGSENYSATFPLISFALNIGSAIALPLVGYLYDFTGSYNIAWIMALGIHGIGLLLLATSVKLTQQQVKVSEIPVNP